ncbi:hypothetical protein SAMN02745181_0419 [Rubritalea squalenifaciens DSM 18772]|uniref:Uncharacterized protein n=2 Tax=Rubritalea TaxID=361050 RepID=A0A1M6C8Q5_9BACT|nr:hypothetical protein [Rubritalea squalenifaciens]SHI57395.1 hypothetical protein SAMN02745181_0419 [Rubritalea squalenifaciens DSM 18772]
MSLIALVLFWIIVALAFVSILPLKLDKAMRSWPLFIPAVAIILFLVREVILNRLYPVESVPIRIDLPLVAAAVIVTFIAALIRCMLIRARTHHRS